MNIDRNSDFGSLEPLMLKISEHLKTDPDPKTNGSRYNKVWGMIFDYTKERASSSNSDYAKAGRCEECSKFKDCEIESKASCPDFA